MNSIRTSLAILFVLASATLSFATSKPVTPASTSVIASTPSVLPAVLNEGPAPRPLCDPSTTVCPSLPTVRPDITLAEGPAPRPLCDPSTTVCPSLPLPLAQLTMGVQEPAPNHDGSNAACWA